MTTAALAGTKRGTRTFRPLILIAACIVALLVVGMFGLMLGTPSLSPAGVWEILGQNGGVRVARLVVLQLRLPRLVLGILAGAALALSGALLQSTLRNALAGPELLGVSTGAAVVMAAITVLHLPVAFALYPWLALLGGLLAGGVVIFVARRADDPARMALVGAATSTLLSALVVVIISLGTAGDTNALFLFLLGSMANRNWEHVNMVAPWVALGVPLALASARTLNILHLGDELAEGLGLRVLRVRLLLLLLSAALVAGVVAVCGPIGYIALLAPHVARSLLGTSDARQVLPVAALIGATLLVSADLLARQLLAPQEIPVGVWTTLIGGPALLLLLRFGRVRLRQ